MMRFAGFFYENGLVQEYNAIYEEDLQHTKRIVLEEFEKRSIWTKLSERIFIAVYTADVNIMILFDESVACVGSNFFESIN